MEEPEGVVVVVGGWTWEESREWKKGERKVEEREKGRRGQWVRREEEGELGVCRLKRQEDRKRERERDHIGWQRGRVLSQFRHPRFQEATENKKRGSENGGS